MLSNEEYEELVIRLLEHPDPYSLILDFEHDFLPENPALWHNFENFLPFVGVKLPNRQQDKYNVVLKIIQKFNYNSKMLRQMPTESFNIADLHFHCAQPTQPNGAPEGKIPVGLCCDPTVEIFEGLRPFKPSKDEFDLFVSAFDRHKTAEDYRRKRDGSHDATIEKIFLRAKVLKPELRDYYLTQLRADAISSFSKNVEFKMEFQVKFDAAMEAMQPAKAEDLNEQKNAEFTTARQVLAMHYLFEYTKIAGIDQTEKARFIEFLTGKNYKNIYDAVRNPLATKDRNLRKGDLRYIRPYFEKLGLREIVKMIDNELDKPDL